MVDETSRERWIKRLGRQVLVVGQYQYSFPLADAHKFDATKSGHPRERWLVVVITKLLFSLHFLPIDSTLSNESFSSGCYLYRAPVEINPLIRSQQWTLGLFKSANFLGHYSQDLIISLAKAKIGKNLRIRRFLPQFHLLIKKNRQMSV